MNKRVMLLMLIMVLGGSAALLGLQSLQEPFPHEPHARLFPLCEGCHEGVPDGDRRTFYPAMALCERCHNGTDEARVNWRPPETRPTSLNFSHPLHERVAVQAGDTLECAGCHVSEGAARMAVRRRVEPERCLSCHAHRAANHFVDARCEQCHFPLAQTRLPTARIVNFSEPSSHDRPDFLERLHGELARTEPQRCSVCHTRETCESCHVDAARNREVRNLPAAPQGMNVPTPSPRYFLPASHREPEWVQRHGGPAQAQIADCAACHTRESCMSCHAQQLPRAAANLPRRAAVAAPGVSTTIKAPPTHATPLFEVEHGNLASARPQSCRGCHARTECEKCHTASNVGKDATPKERAAGLFAHGATRDSARSWSAVYDTVRTRMQSPRGGRADFHPANFLERHASASYGRNLDCQNCHETATFCRDCHERRGMGAVGRLQSAFHDAQPDWLLNHGRPARQGLESCASCHKQRDCTQCHSETGAFRINPHGPGFDAERMIKRNPRVCYACHLTDPTRGRT